VLPATFSSNSSSQKLLHLQTLFLAHNIAWVSAYKFAKKPFAIKKFASPEPKVVLKN
jgi:hypothetical protein